MPNGVRETCTTSVEVGEVRQCHSRMELIRVSCPKTNLRNVSAPIVVSYISLASCHPGTSPNSHNQSTCLQTPHHRATINAVQCQVFLTATRTTTPKIAYASQISGCSNSPCILEHHEYWQRASQDFVCRVLLVYQDHPQWQDHSRLAPGRGLRCSLEGGFQYLGATNCQVQLPVDLHTNYFRDSHPHQPADSLPLAIPAMEAGRPASASATSIVLQV
ncbi:hypothetical protein F5141DRAFT_561232 [Pisolithus sp. B1]|nr:hypothetical protein F5141DRAFT_561232 [Pisolithus sp. B1]